MASVKVERLYETCLRQKATEMWLLAGQTPLLRIEGTFRALEIPPLSAAEVEEILRSISHADHFDYYRKHGFVEFKSSYGNVLVLKIAILNHGGSCLGFFRIMPISLDVSKKSVVRLRLPPNRLNDGDR